MRDLLPFYERELSFLRQHAREFSERYPKIAGNLQLAGDVSEDPHVERLIESFALLSARVSKKIEDEYPEFTNALLEILYPHFLRPFPACSIAQFGGGLAGQLSSVRTIPRGTELRSKPVKGVACRFRSAYPIHLAPMEIRALDFRAVARPPAGCRLPDGSSGQISVTLEASQNQKALDTLDLPNLRLFVDAEPSLTVALVQALNAQTLAAYVEANDEGHWHRLPGNPIDHVGFDPEDALIDYSDYGHGAFQLLSEFFAFPEKFDFIDIDWTEIRPRLPQASRKLALHLVLEGISASSVSARLLENIQAANLKMHCSPVVNLFRQRSEPIRLDQRRDSYPVIADNQHAAGYELFSIESVNRVRKQGHNQKITEFRPLFSLNHQHPPDLQACYWILRRDELLAKSSPGYEAEISLVDIDLDPALDQIDTLSLSLLCSNRDLPETLAHGVEGGDLMADGASQAGEITLLRKPGPSHQTGTAGRRQWQLISQLALDHLSLIESGVESLREMLHLHNLRRSRSSSRLIDSITDFVAQPTTAWLTRGKYQALARGLELKLELDEDNLVGTSLHTFINILDHFLGFYAQANSFIELVVTSRQSGQEIARCQPRSGKTRLA